MSSTNSDASGSATDSATGTAASVTSSIVSSLISSAISTSETLSASNTASDEPTKTSGGILGTTPETTSAADTDRGIGIVTFLTALVVAVVIFTVQLVAFLLLRNKLARILYVTPRPRFKKLCR